MILSHGSCRAAQPLRKLCLCLQCWPEAARLSGKGAAPQDENLNPGWSNSSYRPGDGRPDPDDNQDSVWRLHGADNSAQAEHHYGLHKVGLMVVQPACWVWEAALGGLVCLHRVTVMLWSSSPWAVMSKAYNPGISSPDFASASETSSIFIDQSYARDTTHLY